VCQDPLKIIRLLDFDGESERVDGGFNKDLFVFVAADDDGCE
jgi:hypothetical protein